MQRSQNREKIKKSPGKPFRYHIADDPEDISIGLFRQKKLDMIAFYDEDPHFKDTYLYLPSRDTAEVISELFRWKKPVSCPKNKERDSFFCIKIPGGQLPVILQKLEKNIQMKKVV